MNYTQNGNIIPIKERTLVIGVDIVKDTYFSRAFDYRGIELERLFKFENNREELESFKD